MNHENDSFYKVGPYYLNNGLINGSLGLLPTPTCRGPITSLSDWYSRVPPTLKGVELLGREPQEAWGPGSFCQVSIFVK